jgi:hypothetical protein
MLRKLLFLFAGLLITLNSYCQNGLNNKRPPYKLHLFVNDSLFYDFQLDESPYVINDTILQVFPGEKLFVEAELLNNKLTNLLVVPKRRNIFRTITIQFEQNKVGKTHEQMMLTIKNPFRKNLTYIAKVSLLGENKWVNSTSGPVLAGMESIEIWPDIITSIVLTGFKLDK